MTKVKNLVPGIQRMLDNAEQMTVQREVSNKDKEVEVSFTFKLPKSLHTELKIYAAKHNITIKDLTTKLLKEKILNDEFKESL